MSYVLVPKKNKVEQLVYFVSKVLKGINPRYHKIDRSVSTVLITARKLRPYFQRHCVMVKTNSPIRKILKKTYLAGIMVSWSIELSKYDIHFVPKGSIKSKVLKDFLMEFSSLMEKDVPYLWTLSINGA